MTLRKGSSLSRRSGHSRTDTFDLDARIPPRTPCVVCEYGYGSGLDDRGRHPGGRLRQESPRLLLADAPAQQIPRRRTRVFNHFFDVQRGGRGLTVRWDNWASRRRTGRSVTRAAARAQGRTSSPCRTHGSTSTSRLTASSRTMRDQFTARLFRTLGHVLHLVEDMAQPQHTRNDPHAGCMSALDPIVGGHSWYEHYVENRALRRPFRREASIPPDWSSAGTMPPRFGPIESSSPTRPVAASRTSAAGTSSRPERTSRGGSQPCGGLPEPPCEATAYEQVSRPFSTHDSRRAPYRHRDALHPRCRRRTDWPSDPETCR